MRDTYAMQDKEISVVGAFVAGVTVGVVAGLLLAPRAGPDIRKSLQERRPCIPAKSTSRTSCNGAMRTWTAPWVRFSGRPSGTLDNQW